MSANNTEQAIRLLLVDDEPNILRSLHRLLRQDDYAITLAESGDAAYALLQQQAFDVIVSDARMPGMDGATLLGHAYTLWPDSVRILLTGYADMTTTVKAVNEGQIFRYLSKPWDDDELRHTLQQGLTLQASERERIRLSRIITRQNHQLKQLNDQLQHQVTAKTSELEQTADMLDLTYEELKHSYMQATEVFGSLINMRLPASQHTNARVTELCNAMAALLDYAESDRRNLTMAAALYNIGKLTWDDRLLQLPLDSMGNRERQLWERYPQTSSEVLLGLEPLQETAQIIRHHQEAWNGSGHPDQLTGNAIPRSSQILRLAVDYIELQAGLIVPRQLDREQAIDLIQQAAGSRYSPELVPLFVACTEQFAELSPGQDACVWLSTRQLLPGMVLGKNLIAHSGLLLLNANKALSDMIIDKLLSFEASEQTQYRVPVLKDSLKNSQTIREDTVP